MIRSFVCIFSGFSDSIRKFIVFSVNLTKLLENPKMVVFRIDSLWEIWPRFLGRRAIIRGGGNSNILGIFTRNLGEDEPILTSEFFKGVGSTTNWFPKSKEEIRSFHFLHPFFRWHTVLTNSGSLTASFLLKICKIPKTKGNSLSGAKMLLGG